MNAVPLATIRNPYSLLTMSGNCTVVDTQIEKVRAILTLLPKWG